MKVKDIMTSEPRKCTPDTTLAAAADLMWEGDCGILPVVEDGELVGVVTDRDMFVALATRNTLASQLRIGAVATKAVVTCAPEDDVRAALATMKQARVRRLPVAGGGGTLLGMLSMNDIVLAAGGNEGVRRDEIVDALQAICGHPLPAVRVVAA
jgi:CBS domain-containing protein